MQASPRKARHIYQQALVLNDDTARSDFVNQQCSGDVVLRERVEQLLAARSQQRENLLARAIHIVGGSGGRVEDLTDATVPSEVGTPQDDRNADDTTSIKATDYPMIGPYKLLEQIGEGGFGQVFMAKQAQPVRRKVALKVVKAGMDTQEVLTRFEAEKQSLAMMDHPNIAKVLDAGTTDQGRPYFVMELVRGVSITEFCDENRLTTDKRLSLFADVCRAVQHAHLKGVIHRDLKPSNLLVTISDGEPMVKVIDFGIAKALNQELTEDTLFTAYGQLVGTPLYMSPEQAQFSAHDIDVRSDIYSLGVVLYELLTGQTPFDRELLRKSGLDEMRRVIREVDPPRPSYRISTLRAEKQSTVCAQRRVEMRRLGQSLEGELDWIVMKALAKERDRRYQSASEMAEDVRRYLEGEPIEARPPSLVYRAKKYGSRHKAAMISAALFIVALSIGTSLATWQAIRASRGWAQADAQEARAEREAKTAAAVNNFLNSELLAQANPENQPDPNVTLRAVIDQAAKRLEGRFPNGPLIEAGIRHTLATTYESLGEYRLASQQVQRAINLRTEQSNHNGPELTAAQRLRGWLMCQLGDYVAGEQTLRDLLANARKEHGASHEQTLRVAYRLGLAQTHLFKLSDAEKNLTSVYNVRKKSFGEEDTLALQAVAALGSISLEKGDLETAESLARQVLETEQDVLGAAHPLSLAQNQQLVFVLMCAGKMEEATKICDEAIERSEKTLGSGHPLTLDAKSDKAWLLHTQGEFERALTLFEELLAQIEKNMGKDHPSYLTISERLSNAHREQGNADQAEELLRIVVRQRRRQYGPKNIRTTVANMNLAATLDELGRFREAEEIYREILNIQRTSLGPGHPRTVNTMNNLAATLDHSGRYDLAEDLCRRVIESRSQILGTSHPATLKSMVNHATYLAHLGRADEAEQILVESIALSREALGDNHRTTLVALSELATVYVTTDRLGEAEQLYKQVIEQQTEVLGKEHPNTLNSINNLAIVYMNQKRFDEAKPLYAELLNSRVKVRGNDHPDTIATVNNLGALHGRAGDDHEAARLYERAAESAQRVLGETHPDTRMYHRNWASALGNLGEYGKAEELTKRRIEGCQLEFGDEAQQVIDARDDLAIVYRKSDQIVDWERTVRENLEVKRRVLGEDHSDTRHSMELLGAIRLRKAEQEGQKANWPAVCATMTPLHDIQPNLTYFQALLPACLLTGDVESYRGYSQQAWQQYHHSKKAHEISALVLACCWASHSGVSCMEMFEVAAQALEENPNNSKLRLAAALALYRAGEYDQAVHTTHPGGANWVQPLMALTRAMSHHQLGDEEQAKAELSRGVQLANEIAPSPTEGVELQWAPDRWIVYAIYQVLTAEAESMIGVDVEEMSAIDGT